jgi:hypothetical protein
MQANFEKVPVGFYGRSIPASNYLQRPRRPAEHRIFRKKIRSETGETPVLHCWFAKPVLN